MLAAKINNVSYVQLLLKHGADANVVDKQQKSLLHHAASSHFNYEDFYVMKVLIERGVNVNAKDNRGTTPLMVAARNSTDTSVLFLLEHGADINLVDRDLKTLLHYAACNHTDNVEILKFLIECGANVDAQDSKGRTPLMRAAERNNVSSVRLLLEHGADMSAVDINLNTLFHYCAAASCKVQAASLPAVGASSNDVEIMNVLIERGAIVDAQNSKGRTPLMLAAGYNYASTVQFLLDHGADVSAVDLDLRSPIHYAFHADDSDETVEALIEAGANVDAQDIAGTTPLMFAAEMKKISSVRLLLGHGAVVSAVDREMWAPIHYAALGDDMNVEIMKLLIEAGANVNVRDCDGTTPLMLAADSNNVSSVRLLLEHGADVSAVDLHLWAPIHYATSQYDICDEIVKMLIDAGSNINERDRVGRLLLMLATKQNIK